MLIRSTDGLAVHDLANMDTDQFHEWCWPGTKAKLWTCAVVEGEVKHAWVCAYNYGRGIDERYWFSKLWYEARVYAGNIEEAKRKALAMVLDHVKAKSGPCAMTTGGNHGQE